MHSSLSPGGGGDKGSPTVATVLNYGKNQVIRYVGGLKSSTQFNQETLAPSGFPSLPCDLLAG